MKSRTVGQQTTYDEIDEFDEGRRGQEPGYSDDNKGGCSDLFCLALAVVCVVLLII